MRSDSDLAKKAFEHAEVLVRAEKLITYLYRQPGCHYASYLRQAGNILYAKEIIEAYREKRKNEPVRYCLIESYRVLGYLEADVIRHNETRKYYDEPANIVRETSKRNVLVGALVARGCGLGMEVLGRR